MKRKTGKVQNLDKSNPSLSLESKKGPTLGSADPEKDALDRVAASGIVNEEDEAAVVSYFLRCANGEGNPRRMVLGNVPSILRSLYSALPIIPKSEGRQLSLIGIRGKNNLPLLLGVGDQRLVAFLLSIVPELVVVGGPAENASLLVQNQYGEIEELDNRVITACFIAGLTASQPEDALSAIRARIDELGVDGLLDPLAILSGDISQAPSWDCHQTTVPSSDSDKDLQ